MARSKHGQYSPLRGLPDNTNQPTGSGLPVWLISEIEARFGEEGKKLVDEFRARQKDINAQYRLRDKKHHLERLRNQAGKHSPGGEAYLSKQIQNAEITISSFFLFRGRTRIRVKITQKALQVLDTFSPLIYSLMRIIFVCFISETVKGYMSWWRPVDLYCFPDVSEGHTYP